MNTKKYTPVLIQAIEIADNITPSVLAVAMLADVKAKDLAHMIGDDAVVSNYRADVAKHLQDVLIKQAVEKEEKEKEKKG